ncbi:GNAT family N-acetyltransferase [Allosediminivita pacifica]|uniref:Ribosomal-protein-alanine N-acetyltransferase n=1 Tax=Allosediminivita pacifica TaxID=1267769 RepID=A0A2T6AX77_9RHOB|nr:GNAT family N-acetyltransferase [Allosediminivita pacifica]PTX48398.1 ribosomal-protein-alanine N-acetyltransferase [Allosediminivita pacifica]GGB10786.1 alanine acetyltransferase [Allosediminivita pacifica]
MTPEELAAIAGAAYGHATPWSAADFAGALALPRTLLATDGAAFVLGQVIADEAEILALATRPEAQRTGAASRALEDFETQARDRGAVEVFLEVAEDNVPARAFYDRHGYGVTGRRKGYYPRTAGPAADALLMHKAL